MKQIGIFSYHETITNIRLLKKELALGLNDRGDFIILKNNREEIVYVINKICNHAGGRLIPKGDHAVCPLHGWKLDLSTLKYNDSHVCKESLPYTGDGTEIIIQHHDKEIYNPFKSGKTGEVKIRWLNHACVHIECNGVKLITDPWLFGPAFMTGWWLSQPSPVESIELLKKADYLYISHNHPDHLHPETLAVISRDKPILVADFASRSCEKYLKSLGFTNVIPLNFLEIHELTPGFQCSVFKSGDFRDDSGIYVCANGHEFLLTVDCNSLNSHLLPKNMDMLFTSFAGVASGFPLCFNNYSQEEKMQVLNRNRNTMKAIVKKYIDVTTPSYYMPYAGMFKERAKRDEYIYKNNAKNTVEEYNELLVNSKTQLAEPISGRTLTFYNGKLTSNAASSSYLEAENTDFYITTLKEEYPYRADSVIHYLKQSGYTGNQLIQFIPTADDFSKIAGSIVYADFKNQVFNVIEPRELISEQAGMRVLKLFIRAEVLMCVVENKLPWEDFSIGYQMRVERNPNEYESELWYHFTNVYIGSENFRHSSYCGACTVIDQNPIWNKAG